MKLLETIRCNRLYRGQIRAVLSVGQAQAGPFVGQGKSVPDHIGAMGRWFLDALECKALSQGQYDGLNALMDGTNTVLLAGPAASGLTSIGITAAFSMAADRFADVLCVASGNDVLRSWKDAYLPKFSEIRDNHGLFDADVYEQPPDLCRNPRPFGGRLVMTSMDGFLSKLGEYPDLNWLEGYSFVYFDCIHDLLQDSFPADSTAVLAHAIFVMRQRNPALQICASCSRFEGNARFVAELTQDQKLEIIEFESIEGQKTFALWSAPLDREKYGGEIKPGDFFDELVTVCRILSEAEYAVRIYDATGVFCRAEREQLLQRISIGAQALVFQFCDTERAFTKPAGEAEGYREPIRICLGFGVPLGLFRDRMRSISSPDALVIFMEARTPLANIHRHYMSRHHAGLDAGLPPECRFAENAHQISLFRALGAIDSETAFIVCSRYLGANGVSHLTAAHMKWASRAWGDLYGNLSRVKPRQIPIEEWKPLDVTLDVAEIAASSGSLEEGDHLIATDCYPGALVNKSDRRYQVIAPGPDLADPWRNAQLQPSTDSDRDTVRLFDVRINQVDGVKPIGLDLPHTLFSGVRYAIQKARIQETVTGFETVGRFSGDLHRIGGRIAPLAYPVWVSDVLCVRLDEAEFGAGAVAAFCAVFPDAIALRIANAKTALSCIMLDSQGLPCKEADCEPVALAIYARDSRDHVLANILGTAGLLQDIFRLALAVLLACPCRYGCSCCINIIGLPVAWRERIDKDGLTRLLGRLLGYSEAEKVVEDRREIHELTRVVDRIRDAIIPHQLACQLNMDFPLPVTLRHLVGRVAASNPDAIGLFTGDAVYVRPDLDESTYIGLLSHEYMHQWQRDFLDPDLEKANGENIEDPDNVLFPAYHPGSWNCRGNLYVEGGAEWLRFRVADAYNLKTTMEQTADGFRGNEYGEGFQHVIWLERKYGMHELIAMMRKDRPDSSVYRDFSSNPNPKTALYEASLLNAALSDSALDLIEQGGFACCESRGDWPFHTRVSHYRAQYRKGGAAMPPLDVMETDSDSGKKVERPITVEKLAEALLDVSVGACLEMGADVIAVLRDAGLHCAGCACSQSDRPCSLRTAAYMHSNASTSARQLGESLAAKISEVVLAVSRVE